MSLYLDSQYVTTVQVRLRNFKKKRDGLYNFSCPFCGDSKKDKSKARGYLYRKGNALFYKCHNCPTAYNFGNFLKALDPSLYDTYVADRYKSGDVVNVKKTEIERVMDYKQPVFNRVPEKIFFKDNCIRVYDLPDDHICKQYVLKRKLPEEYFKSLYWTEDYRSVAMGIDKEKYSKLRENDARLVIPFIDADKETVLAIQGRTLDPTSKLRYITCKAGDDTPKIYGLDRVDIRKPIYVLEGALDSMFIPNSIAACQGDLRLVERFVPKEKCILIPDRDVRNKEICKLIEAYIKTNWNVCLLPDNMKGKDINEYILNGLTKDQLLGIIASHTYDGLTLQIEFSSWKK